MQRVRKKGLGYYEIIAKISYFVQHNTATKHINRHVVEITLWWKHSDKKCLKKVFCPFLKVHIA